MKILLNEGQYRLLFENDELNHQIQGLWDLIKSGTEENIGLAFQVAESLDIPDSILLEPFRELFEFLKTFKQIKSEILDKNALNEITSLDYLYLADLPITELPESFGLLTSLVTLNLNGTQITELPQSFGNLKSLLNLNLVGTPIKELPSIIMNLTALESLYIADTQIQTLPESFGNLTSLQWLNLQLTPIKELPKSFENLTSLEWLNLNNTKISKQEKQRIRQILPKTKPKPI